ncbi:L-fuculokinase [Candidatus Aerophobetes bacterium]|nr:L-fuculokinase [Candidatus Aerophobetes bacterium]
MNKEELAIVLDCGATNIRVAAVNKKGEIISEKSFLNRPIPQPGGEKNWLIWDVEEIWGKICRASKKVCSEIDKKNIKVVTVTSFGADGAPVDKKGNLLYPVISWGCSRGKELTTELEEVISPWEVYQRTGYQFIPFNAIFRIFWLKRNEPHILDKTYKWLMFPGIINQRLSGEFTIDPTSASTIMAMDLKKRDWWGKILEIVGIDSSLFPSWREPGEIVGKITNKSSKETGIPRGTPVVMGGHDVQFATIGAGGSPGEVILNSGTWEILTLRLSQFKPTREGFEGGLTVESDILPGLWIYEIFMIASGVVEWVKRHFYAGLSHRKNKYDTMISEGEKISPEENKVRLIPEFSPKPGPARKFYLKGTLLGLTLATQRGEVYRATLEGLSFQLREALELLRKATGFYPENIRIVGGGAKNKLWNQIKADVTGLPLITIQHKEATVIGAGIIGFLGIGIFNSIEEGQKTVNFTIKEKFEPTQNQKIYEKLYHEYKENLRSLKEIYSKFN